MPLEVPTREQLSQIIDLYDKVAEITAMNATARADALTTVYEDAFLAYKENHPHSTDKEAHVFAQFIVQEVNNRV